MRERITRIPGDKVVYRQQQLGEEWLVRRRPAWSEEEPVGGTGMWCQGSGGAAQQRPFLRMIVLVLVGIPWRGKHGCPVCR